MVREVSLVILRCTHSVSYDKMILGGNGHIWQGAGLARC
jgi:hypothetical protein